MESLYDPSAVERRWQETWEAEGLYAAGAGRRRDESFVICVPPPNVTGELHMGHALNGSIQDVLIRWHRMRGFDTLWQPGYDHAGISTQNVVEKQLIAEGTSRQEIGRDAFLERTWSWLETTGRTIMGQFRRLGASLDYSRERFTMDDGVRRGGDDASSSVSGTQAGSTARTGSSTGARTTRRRSPTSRSSTSRWTTRSTYVRYPFADGRRAGSRSRRCGPRRSSPTSRSPCIPTIRATASAIGREVVVPVVERRVPVIADARVDPEFGTGAVKVTPGHDPMDFDIGRDHGLATLTVIGPDGRMIAEGFEGLDAGGGRRARRSRGPDERGLVEKREPYRHSVGTCERCHSRIEPLVSPQWWCAMEGLAAPAIEALRERRVRFHPESQHRFAIESLEQAPDWCVSRQLWWGHQIPIWTCPDGHLTCAWPPPGRVRRVRRRASSSATRTCSTRGSRPRSGRSRRSAGRGETPELERYYRGDVNSTAREIIRLWENRMIFSGLVPARRDPVHAT